MRDALKIIRTQKAMLSSTPSTTYGEGYLQALLDLEELMEDVLWEVGEDASE